MRKTYCISSPPLLFLLFMALRKSFIIFSIFLFVYLAAKLIVALSKKEKLYHKNDLKAYFLLISFMVYFVSSLIFNNATNYLLSFVLFLLSLILLIISYSKLQNTTVAKFTKIVLIFLTIFALLAAFLFIAKLVNLDPVYDTYKVKKGPQLISITNCGSSIIY